MIKWKLYLFHQHDRALYQTTMVLEQDFPQIENEKAALQRSSLQVETVFLSDPELLKALPKLAKGRLSSMIGQLFLKQNLLLYWTRV